MTVAASLLETATGWRPVADLALAFVLSSLIGLERELRNKSAGLRTHTIVGTASALITLVGAYGFPELVDAAFIRRDPTRVAAQIVSGIGFIGGGLIFVRRDAVRGLTTAAVIWEAAAIGMACAAGLPALALLMTGAHFVVVYGYTALSRRLPTPRESSRRLNLTFREGGPALRDAIVLVTSRGFRIEQVSVSKVGPPESGSGKGRESEDLDEDGLPRHVSVLLEVIGVGSISELVTALSEHEQVVSVSTAAGPETTD